MYYVEEFTYIKGNLQTLMLPLINPVMVYL